MRADFFSEDEVRRHPRLLRIADSHWWRSVLSVVAFGFAFLCVQLGMTLFEVVLFGGFGGYLGQPMSDGTVTGPVPALYGVAINLLYVGLTVLAVRVGFGVTGGWILSVAGRWRWGWSGVCAVFGLVAGATIVVLGLVGLAGRVTTSEPEAPTLGALPAAGWVLLAVAVAVSTAALEEVAIRGWLAQSVGALVSSPRVGVLLAAGISTWAFVWLRGPVGPGETIVVASLGLVLFLLVWTTGGVEASIAVNAGLQLAVLAPLAARHGLDTAIADVPPTGLAELVVALAVTVALVVVGRRLRLQKRGRPEQETRELSDLSDVRGVR